MFGVVVLLVTTRPRLDATRGVAWIGDVVVVLLDTWRGVDWGRRGGPVGVGAMLRWQDVVVVGLGWRTAGTSGGLCWKRSRGKLKGYLVEFSYYLADSADRMLSEKCGRVVVLL